MLSSLFSGDTSTLEWRSLLICIAASLLLGILVAAIHMIRNVYTKTSSLPWRSYRSSFNP